VFPRIEYLHWIEGRAEAAEHDLGSTDLRLGDPLDRLGDRPDPAGGVTLQALLAEAVGVGESRVLVTAGATHANFLAIAAALDGSDGSVLVESPGYEPLAATPAGFGATVRRFDRPPDADYALDTDRVAGALTDETTLVAVTDRHNPSGRRASAASLDAVAEVVGDADARLLVDEVYAPFGDDPDADANFGAGTAAGLEHAVVTGSLTKFFGLGDLRIGWMVAEPPFLERVREISAHVPTVSALTKRLAARLLADPTAATTRARARASTNATRLQTFLRERSSLEGTVHEPCPFAFPAHTSADGDRVAEAAWDAGVLVVPGRFFGDPDRFRIAAAAGPAVTQRALDAFGAVLDGL
jgi:aspartate/methionine/tyrosine aminotransferase